MLNVNQQPTALLDVNYLVVGLGLSGYSTARYLLRNGYRCRVQDTRDIPPYLGHLRADFDGLEFYAGALTTEICAWADVLVVSPGLSVRQAEIQQAAGQGKAVIGDIELFARLVDKPVVAITGSNGKSTVTTLVGEMISADRRRVAIGGNLGTPVLDLLESEAEYYVLELSSYQLETTSSLRPRIAVLLNLSEDHLDRYESYDGYVEAKMAVYRNAEICVSNFDDPSTRHDERDIGFSLDPDSAAEFRLLEHQGLWLAHRDEAWLRVDQLAISGRHNWANALAAMAIAYSLGVSKAAIVGAMQATNVGAAQASIEGRTRPVILIAGGQSKGADMSVMSETIHDKVKLVLLLGEDAPLLQQVWGDATRIERVESMREAVQHARQVAVSGDCVLLAPACASFDMYPKFEARGDDFMQCVQELIGV
jgi:UDP-N-acetylmuramoylalanine--D-glutamate ligase